jgi:hypothetical protein
MMRAPDPTRPLNDAVPVNEVPSRSTVPNEREKPRAAKDDDALPIEDLPPRQNVRGG